MRAFWDRLKLWFAARFFILTVIFWINIFRRRMSHNNAIGGRGKLKIVTEPKFPASDFFEPGREFPCRIRHGAAGYMDDAMGQVRSGSLKFADSRFRSPFDLQMNTGRHCFFWNASSFLEFVTTRIKESMLHNTDGDVHYLKYHKKYADAGIVGPFVQDNFSKSQKGTLRGLHAQLTHPQAKLVHILSGVIWDVAVDIRPESPTYKKWVGVTLSAETPMHFLGL